MADWGDDDDFGGFESADIGDTGAIESTQKTDTQTDNVTQQNESGAQVQILDWILSNTPKPDVSSPQLLETKPVDISAEIESGSTQDKTMNGLSQGAESQVSQEDSPASISYAEQFKERLNESADIAKNLDDIFAGTGDASFMKQKEDVTEKSTEFKEAQSALHDTASQDPIIQKTVDNDALHKLQAQLDTALIMKEQTEQTMEELQSELKELSEKRKEDFEKCKGGHEEEINVIKNQHHDEINELQKISEETVKLVTKQYSEIWKLFEKEKSLESEENANSIMEKCILVMQQQQATLSEKIENCRKEQENEVKNVLKEERENMEKELKSAIKEEKLKLEKELTKELQDKMNKEAERLQEVHTSTLQEAMSKQQTHFEQVLQNTLQTEREKFANTLKSAVLEAQENSEKSAVERMKVEQKRMKSHTMAVKMLLTSALQQVEQNFPSETTENQTDAL